MIYILILLLTYSSLNCLASSCPASSKRGSKRSREGAATTALPDPKPAEAVRPPLSFGLPGPKLTNNVERSLHYPDQIIATLYKDKYFVVAIQGPSGLDVTSYLYDYTHTTDSVGLPKKSGTNSEIATSVEDYEESLAVISQFKRTEKNRYRKK